MEKFLLDQSYRVKFHSSNNLRFCEKNKKIVLWNLYLKNSVLTSYTISYTSCLTTKTVPPLKSVQNSVITLR